MPSNINDNFIQAKCNYIVANNPDIALVKPVITSFADAEMQCVITQNLRGKTVFILGSLHDLISEKLLLLAIDAVRAAKATNIIPIILYMGYARDDVRTEPGASLGSKVLVQCIEAMKPTSAVVFDIHNEHVLGYFDIPIDHIDSLFIFKHQLLNLFTEAAKQKTKLSFLSPDNGGVKRIKWAFDKMKEMPRFKTILDQLDINFVFCNKYRSKPNVVQTMELIGDVNGRLVILLDDIVDTAGTLVKAASIATDNGALSVIAFITHPVFSDFINTMDRIKSSNISKLYVADTIPVKGYYDKNKISFVDIDRVLYDIVTAISNNKPIHFNS
jgi:ribose-phosphate pyrophosphokinase